MNFLRQCPSFIPRLLKAHRVPPQAVVLSNYALETYDNESDDRVVEALSIS